MFRLIGGIALAASGFFLKKYLDEQIKEKHPNLKDYDLENYEDAFVDVFAKGLNGAGEYAQDFGKWLKEKAKDIG